MRSTFIKETPESSLSPLQYEDTAKRPPFMNQSVGPHQTLNLLVP